MTVPNYQSQTALIRQMKAGKTYRGEDREREGLIIEANSGDAFKRENFPVGSGVTYGYSCPN